MAAKKIISEEQKATAEEQIRALRKTNYKKSRGG